MITKEQFINWLKEKNFYDQWMEAYQLDNELYNDNVALDDFLKKCNPISWFYNGITSVVLLCDRPDPSSELSARIKLWREANMSGFGDRDEEWMNYVRNTEGFPPAA